MCECCVCFFLRFGSVASVSCLVVGVVVEEGRIHGKDILILYSLTVAAHNLCLILFLLAMKTAAMATPSKMTIM